MDYREFEPPPALESVVRCIWTLKAEEGFLDPSPVLPDGHPELVVNFGDPMRHHPIRGGVQVQPAILLAGVITRPFHLSATGPVDLVGVRFQPAGAWSLAGGDMSPLVDGWTGLEDVAPLRAALLDSANRQPTERVEAISQAVCAVLREAPARPNDAVVRAANRLVDSERDVPVEELAREVSLSPRQLARRFRREVGVGPKVLSRLVRFQRALRALTGPDALPAAQAAVAAGYADQAHMISDVSDLAGLSPGRLLRSAPALANLFTGADLSGPGGG